MWLGLSGLEAWCVSMHGRVAGRHSCPALEFARTSLDGRLTLVLTPGSAPVTSLWTEVDYSSSDEARLALMTRENSKSPAIVGLWPGPSLHDDLGADVIAAWATARGIGSVV